MFENFAYPEKWSELDPEVVNTVGRILMNDAGGLLRNPILAALGYGAVTHVETAHALWKYYSLGISGAAAVFRAVPVDVESYVNRFNERADLAAVSSNSMPEEMDLPKDVMNSLKKGLPLETSVV